MRQSKSLFHALVDYYNQLVELGEKDGVSRITSMYYKILPIDYEIVLDLQGRVVGIHSLTRTETKTDKNGKRKKVEIKQMIQVPGIITRGTSQKATIGWDANHTYLFNPKSTEFQSSKSLHLSLQEEINHPHFDAICEFFHRRSANEQMAVALPVPKETAKWSGVFRVAEDGYVFNEEAIEPIINQHLADDFLAHNCSKGTRTRKPVNGQCLVCGDHKQIARLHEPRLQTGSTGTSLASFNSDVYWSHGKKDAFNASMCLDCVIKYCQTINHLLISEEHKRFMADSRIVFWADPSDGVIDDTTAKLYGQFLSSGPLEGALASVLESLTNGHLPPTIEDVEASFYIVGLTPGAGRSSLSCYHCCTISEILHKLQTFFQDFAIRTDRRKQPQYPTIRGICESICHDPLKVPTYLPGTLMKAVLDGHPYPDAICHGALSRLKKMKIMTPMIAAILRGCLNRNFLRPLSLPEVNTVLNRERPEPSYQLGRYLGLCVKIQKTASPGINRPLSDRFLSSMMTTPGIVYPELRAYVQIQLAKIKSGGLRAFYEKLIGNITTLIDNIPVSLQVKDQCLFALGYDHEVCYYGEEEKVDDTTDSDTSDQTETTLQEESATVL